MYQALYRKWRPQIFDDVIGQQHITETLKNQVKTGRLSHAYIFIGTRGTGKTTCARILARAVNCEHPVDGNPCGHCAACRGISEGTVLDVVELDAASNNSVDNVRALREEAVFTPASVKKRVYIIDEVHMLSTAAFNALLKILEEPPEHLMFILATTELQKVPATILSRCQRHSFKRIDSAVIAEYLEKIAGQEGFRLAPDAAQLIARLADGGVRDALSLLDQCASSESIDLDTVYSSMGLAGNRRTAALLDLIIKHQTEKAIREFNALWMDGKDPAVFLADLSGLLRDTLMMKVAPRGGANLISGGYDNATLLSLARQMTQEEILCAMETLQNSLAVMRSSPYPKTTAELCLVSLCDNTLGDSVSALKARISRLEEQLGNPAVAARVLQSRPDEEQLPPPPEDEYPEPAPYPMQSQPSAQDEEDELDPAMFAEEQPEDSFVQRSDKIVPKPAPAAEQNAEPSVSWEAICQELEGIPGDIRAKLGDRKIVTGRMENGVLQVRVVPGFYYGRFNRQDVMAKFSAAASRLCGREVRAMLSELEDKPQGQRSLEELKAFKEVRFI